MTTKSEDIPCYVARKACGCAVAACVDEPQYAKLTAKDIAGWIRRGLTIEHQTVAWARENLKRCTHAPAD